MIKFMKMQLQLAYSTLAPWDCLWHCHYHSLSLLLAVHSIYSQDHSNFLTFATGWNAAHLASTTLLGQCYFWTDICHVLIAVPINGECTGIRVLPSIALDWWVSYVALRCLSPYRHYPAWSHPVSFQCICRRSSDFTRMRRISVRLLFAWTRSWKLSSCSLEVRKRKHLQFPVSTFQTCWLSNLERYSIWCPPVHMAPWLLLIASRGRKRLG